MGENIIKVKKGFSKKQRGAKTSWLNLRNLKQELISMRGIAILQNNTLWMTGLKISDILSIICIYFNS